MTFLSWAQWLYPKIKRGVCYGEPHCFYGKTKIKIIKRAGGRLLVKTKARTGDYYGWLNRNEVKE